jgi:hypothetical protein
LLATSEYEWGPPENLGPAINTQGRDLSGSLTADELTLVYSSQGKLCLSQRKSRSEPFPSGEPLPAAIQEQAGEMSNISGDGLVLVFASRPGPNEDIFVTSRPSRAATFESAVRLASPVNSPEHERVPVLSGDGLTLFVTTIRRNIGSGQVRQYTRASREAPFSEETILSSHINTAFFNTADSLSPDGLVLLATVMGKPPFVTHLHTRESVTASFGPGQPLGGRFAELNPGHPWLSPDGERMYFHSREVPGGHGDLDLWVSQRQRKP